MKSVYTYISLSNVKKRFPKSDQKVNRVEAGCFSSIALTEVLGNGYPYLDQLNHRIELQVEAPLGGLSS